MNKCFQGRQRLRTQLVPEAVVARAQRKRIAEGRLCAVKVARQVVQNAQRHLQVCICRRRRRGRLELPDL